MFEGEIDPEDEGPENDTEIYVDKGPRRLTLDTVAQPRPARVPVPPQVSLSRQNELFPGLAKMDTVSFFFNENTRHHMKDSL